MELVAEVAIPDITASGNLTADAQSIALSLFGQSTWTIDLRGTFNAGTTILFQGSVDGANWDFTNVRKISDQTGATIQQYSGAAAGAGNGIFKGECASYAKVRVLVSGFAGGDNVAVSLRAGIGASPVDKAIGSWLGSTAPTVGQKTMAASVPVVLPSDLNAQFYSPDTNGTLVALGGANAVATVLCAGMRSVSMELAAGTLIGTIVVEACQNITAGTPNWQSSAYLEDPVSLASTSQSITFSIANTQQLKSIVIPHGCQAVRIRVSSYTSGTANCTLRAVAGESTVRRTRITDIGSMLSANVQASGGLNGLGIWDVRLFRGAFSICIVGLVPAASPTDIFAVTGASGKFTRLHYMRVSGLQTSAGSADVTLVKRSTANSGGTTTAVTVVPHDSVDALSSTVAAYTANPTLGTLVGLIRATKVTLGTNGSTVAEWTFGTRSGKPPVLRNTSQVLALNLNGVSLSGNNLDIECEITEDTA